MRLSFPLLFPVLILFVGCAQGAAVIEAGEFRLVDDNGRVRGGLIAVGSQTSLWLADPATGRPRLVMAFEDDMFYTALYEPNGDVDQILSSYSGYGIPVTTKSRREQRDRIRESMKRGWLTLMRELDAQIAEKP